MNFNEYKSSYKSILKLGLPIMVGQIGIIVVGFVDTMMVGHYSTDSLAAASFVNTIFNLITMVCMGFSYGLTPIVASLFGKGESGKAGEAFKNGLALNLFFGGILTIISIIVFFCIDYMGQPTYLLPMIKDYYLTMLFSLIFVAVFNAFRQFSDGIGQVSVTMWIIISSNLFNIIFNYLLIFGKVGFPELGLLGAGLSTAMARILSAVAAIVMFHVGKRYEMFRGGSSFRHLDIGIMKNIFNISWPVALQMGLETGFFTFAGVMMGWLGAIALASYQIMVVIGMLGFIIYYSVGASMSIRMSQQFGQKDYEAVGITSRCGLHIMLGIMLVASAIFFFCGEQLISIFTTDKAVVSATMLLIIPMIVYQFGDALQVAYSNSLRGISYVLPMTWVALIAYVGIGIPISYLFAFPLGGGAVGIYLAFSVGLLSAAVLYRYFYVKRLRKLQCQR